MLWVKVFIEQMYLEMKVIIKYLALLALYEGNTAVASGFPYSGFPLQGASDAGFNISFDVNQTKL